jgi:hypothetical protein
MTLVAMNNDVMPGNVYFYIGQKQKNGSEIEQAGLTGGKLYGVKTAEAVENAERGRNRRLCTGTHVRRRQGSEQVGHGFDGG